MPPENTISRALGTAPLHRVTNDAARLKSLYAVTPLAAAAVGAVGDAMAALLGALGHGVPDTVEVDARLASLWFDRSLVPVGWELPPIWDAVAGDYPTADGWIRLHTNLDHHRAAALSVLGCAPDRETVARVVRAWQADALETAVVDAGGVAAAMRTVDQWAAHSQGRAVADEPLIAWGAGQSAGPRDWGGRAERPLAGLRVLDLTRVLAGPVATRTLAGFGADVLRIDPPGWDEPNVVPDVTLGKRCAVLNLRQAADRRVFEALMARADVIVHGYRGDALGALGYGDDARAALAPGIVDVSLNAYGWTGPWAGRRGFDSLVQMSTGIAAAGQVWAKADRPVPLPVQALDHATGYLMAAAVLSELARGVAGQGPRSARLSLARTAQVLTGLPAAADAPVMAPGAPGDLAGMTERTVWGDGRRLRPPLRIGGVPMMWDRPAAPLGSGAPDWGVGGG